MGKHFAGSMPDASTTSYAHSMLSDPRSCEGGDDFRVCEDAVAAKEIASTSCSGGFSLKGFPFAVALSAACDTDVIISVGADCCGLCTTWHALRRLGFGYLPIVEEARRCFVATCSVVRPFAQP